MALSKKELERRKKHIGASESAAVLGESKYSTPADVYWEKVSEEVVDKSSDAIDRGNYLEPAIHSYAEDTLGIRLRRNQFRAKGIMAATFDALPFKANGEACEYKSANLRAFSPWEWGKPETDEIPIPYWIQGQHQMFVGDLKRVHFFVITSGLEFQHYVVDRDCEFIDGVLVPRLTEFWTRHVVPRVPPGDAPPPIEILQARKREPNKVIEFDTEGEAWEAVQEWERAKEREKREKSEEEFWKSKTINALQDAEAAQLPDGRMLKFMEQTRRSLDTNKLRLDHPDIYREYEKETSFRVARIVGKKSDLWLEAEKQEQIEEAMERR